MNLGIYQKYSTTALRCLVKSVVIDWMTVQANA